jgi:septum formation topological specificity factor MinE
MSGQEGFTEEEEKIILDIVKKHINIECNEVSINISSYQDYKENEEDENVIGYKTNVYLQVD